MNIDQLAEDLRQVAREIYYAKHHIVNGTPRYAQANLDMALYYLGVDRPGDVGLSDSVLRREEGRDEA